MTVVYIDLLFLLNLVANYLLLLAGGRLAGTVLTYGVVSAVIFGAIRYLLFGGAL